MSLGRLIRVSGGDGGGSEPTSPSSWQRLCKGGRRCLPRICNEALPNYRRMAAHRGNKARSLHRHLALKGLARRGKDLYVEVGKQADLVLIDGDPHSGVGAPRKMWAVFQRGRRIR